MKKLLLSISLISISLLFGCDDKQEKTIPIPNEPVEVLTKEKKCVGYDKHEITKTFSREYAVIASGNDCLDESRCKEIKEKLIKKAITEATEYCNSFNCLADEKCEGKFTLSSSDCNVSQTKDGACKETVTIKGTIDCLCK